MKSARSDDASVPAVKRMGHLPASCRTWTIARDQRYLKCASEYCPVQRAVVGTEELSPERAVALFLGIALAPESGRMRMVPAQIDLTAITQPDCGLNREPGISGESKPHRPV